MVMGPVTLVADRETKEHSNSYVVTRASLETRDQAAQTDIPYDALRVKRAEQVIQALSITVQYLAYEVRCVIYSFFLFNLYLSTLYLSKNSICLCAYFFFYFNIQLDAFSTPKLKKDCENMKKEWMSSCAEIEKLRARNLGIEDRLESERESHRRALDQLREDRKPCQELFCVSFFV